MSTSPVGKKKKKVYCATGRLCISYTFNNVILSITNLGGDVLLQKSPASFGFKGKRRGTPTALLKVVSEIGREAKDRFGMESVSVKLKGPGMIRDGWTRALLESGIDVNSIEVDSCVPHNGTRPKKRRRV